MSKNQAEALAMADAVAGDWEAVRHHLVVAMLREQHAKIERLEAELVKESGRTAEQKLRADQMTKQHDMACKMNKGAIPAGYALVPVESTKCHACRNYNPTLACTCEFKTRRNSDASCFAAPAPSQQKREPLSDAEIEEIAKPFVRNVGCHSCGQVAIPDQWSCIKDFAKAIERAHGIGQEKKDGA